MFVGLPWQKVWMFTVHNMVEKKKEPSHEIMALFIHPKFIRQTHMCMHVQSHPVGLDVSFFGRTLRLLPYFKRVNSKGSGKTVPEPSLVAYMISIIIS